MFILLGWIFRPLLMTVGAISLVGYFTNQDINLMLDGIASSFSMTYHSIATIAKGGI